MKKTILLFLVLISIFFISCLNFKFEDEEQIYPRTDFENVYEIGVYQFANKKRTRFIDSAKINSIINILKDSSNYFNNEKIKFNGVKPIYSLTFKSSKEIPDFQIYPTEEKDKIEMAFFDLMESDASESSRRNYNRFYLNKKLLNTVEN